MVEQEASDLYLYVGSPPVMRIQGELHRLEAPPITPVTAQQSIHEILTTHQRETFEREWQLDFAYSMPGVSRFRVSLSLHRGTVAASFRMIPRHLPTLAELRVPPAVPELCTLEPGLVVVTGPAGGGKSTTLAALIDHLNQHWACTINTVEDPIEYLHTHKRALIGQQEVGLDVPSMATALRQILRQHPDVVLISDLCDPETLLAAIMLAETGQLVLTALRARNSVDAVRRLVEFSAPGHQEQIAQQLAATLRGVIAQVLVPRRDGPGRVAAFEVLRMTPYARSCVRQGEWSELAKILEEGRSEGMVTFRESLEALVREGLILPEPTLPSLEGLIQEET